jgi:hypothetical protein
VSTTMIMSLNLRVSLRLVPETKPVLPHILLPLPNSLPVISQLLAPTQPTLAPFGAI